MGKAHKICSDRESTGILNFILISDFFLMKILISDLQKNQWVLNMTNAKRAQK